MKVHNMFQECWLYEPIEHYHTEVSEYNAISMR